MLLVAFLGWWYNVGWLTVARKTGHKVTRTLEFFSVEQLLGSLFAPFRQISAGKVRGPLGVQLRAWTDRLFSRMVGAVVRLILIMLGLIVAGLYGLLGLLVLAAWPLLPIMPVLGIALMVVGYLA